MGTEPDRSGDDVRSPSILLVEDETIIRLMLCDIVEELGLRVHTAPDAECAVALLETGERFDLLITDVGLPRMSGYALAEIARRCLPSLPVLFVTGYAGPEDEVAILRQPGVATIVKPFTTDAFIRSVQNLLGAAQDDAPLRA